MDTLKLYRKRLIPDECIKLSDEVILREKDILVTKWKTINPRPVLDHGCSVYYFADGYKISRFYDKNHDLLYHYCDMITHTYDEAQNALTVIDLLADVIVYTDGMVKVIDLDEVADALDSGLLTLQWCKMSMRSMSNLLNIIYDKKLPELTGVLDKIY